MGTVTERSMIPEIEPKQRLFINLEEIFDIKSIRPTISAYLNYSDAAEEDVRRCESSFEKLSQEHKALLSHLSVKYQRIKRCISANSSFIMNMLQQSTLPNDWIEVPPKLNVPLADVGKVRSIIRTIVRDWTVEGQRERDRCYKPILEELHRIFPDRSKERPPRCLIPGAGLGRLALEISSLGFVSQGNEFSSYMLICTSFILNQTEAVNQWIAYPWIHCNSNFLSDEDQFRPVSFPDIQPSARITEGFSMRGGDFVEVYKAADQEASWDAVVTCFFIDTARNIVQYIEVISKVLKEGGVWINLGPLLYHFGDSDGPNEEMSIEISLEDVKMIASHYGFELEVEKRTETTFAANSRSMMQNHYYPVFWTMKKMPKK